MRFVFRQKAGPKYVDLPKTTLFPSHLKEKTGFGARHTAGPFNDLGRSNPMIDIVMA